MYLVKGFEFFIVFIMGMEELLFLYIRVIKSEDDYEMEEECCICYVVIIWVEELFYIINVMIRMLFGCF